MIIFAYVDPGLGALIWQSIVAAVVGVFFYLKKTRRWIVGAYRKMVGRSPLNPPTAVKPITPTAPTVAKIESNVEAR